MPEPDRTIRPFADFLKDQRRGVCESELAEKLNELVQACSLHQKVGTLTLRIKVSPAGNAGMGTVLVSDDITIKKPEGERSDSIFYVDGDCNLIRHDPRQLSLSRELPEEQPTTPTGEDTPDA